ncbi:MAG: beta-ketoacyl-ACP synthase II [Planctomycetes bacterium]|nr:beta-ketoacyl-ACP synthase II [Planctomycetota bacterium]
MTSDRRVVITGMGLVTSLGQTVSQFWDGLVAGRSGVRPITRFDVSEYDSRIAGEIPEFDPASCIDAREVKRIDRFGQFAIVAAAEAVADCGLDFAKEDPYRCGVLVGSGIGGLHEIETQFERLLEKGPGRVSAFLVPKLMANAASALISIRYGLKGPNVAVVSACASATNSIGDAFKVVERGEADIMISGGSEAAITRIGLSGFCAMKALSTRNDEPERASRPFDRDRDGFVMGEGAGILVLEEMEHAKARGARIYAEVIGYGMAGDGCHITAPDEEGRGAAAAMEDALHDAGLNPEDVDYINAHGTSTGLGDAMEVRAVRAVFGEHARRIPISSTKSFIGHLLGASGAVELIATVRGMQENMIHATLNFEHPDDGVQMDFVPGAARKAKVDVAISNSFGFGGHNACLAVRRV